MYARKCKPNWVEGSPDAIHVSGGSDENIPCLIMQSQLLSLSVLHSSNYGFCNDEILADCGDDSWTNNQLGL